MRKLPFLFLATILSVGATAQTLIPKVGGTFSTFAASDDVKELFYDDDLKFKPGFMVGVGFEIGISDAFAIQPELLFQQKGGMSKPEGGKVIVNLNYLELPVMFKYKVSNFYFNAGPYVAYGLGGKYKVKPDDGAEVSIGIKFGEGDDSSDDFYLDNALDFGLQIGGGIILIDKIIIDLRYGHGFGNLMDEQDGFDVEWKNRSIQLSVGYPISFK